VPTQDGFLTVGIVRSRLGETTTQATWIGFAQAVRQSEGRRLVPLIGEPQALRRGQLRSLGRVASKTCGYRLAAASTSR
jgi:hypothetical protein